MDLTYSLRLGAKPKPMEQDEAAVERLRYELFRSACTLQLWVGASHRLSLAAQTAISCQLGSGGRQAVGKQRGAGLSTTPATEPESRVRPRQAGHGAAFPDLFTWQESVQPCCPCVSRLLTALPW